MTTRRLTLAAALGVALVAAGAHTAVAAPNLEGAAGRPVLTWEAEVGDATTVDGSLFGRVVVVPGHEQSRTLVVTNDGEMPGTLTASIVNAQRHQSPADAFLHELMINGHSANRLADERETPLTTVPLAAGESVEVPVSITFDSARTTGNRAVVGEQSFGFDVRLVLSGDLPDGAVTPVPPAPDVHHADTAGAGAPVPGHPVTWDGKVSATGGTGLDNGLWHVLVAGLGVLAALAAAVRRSTRDEEP